MSRLVGQARTYLDVPYKHRGRSRMAVDCAGLLVLCHADLGDSVPDIKRYGREPHKDGLMAGVIAALGYPVWTGRPGSVVPRELLQPGDEVVMRFVREPHHLGIIGDDKIHGLSLIHCYGDIGRVVEHGLDLTWQKKICAVFRKPL